MKKILLFLTVGFFAQSVFAQNEVTILFTSDLHSAFIGGSEKGGYARLYTLIKSDRERYAPDNTLLLDAGDIAMGSFFHTLFTTESAELRLMGKMGYDATTFGNHDFDFGIDGLADALNVAKSHAPAPKFVAANIKPKNDNKFKKALEHYGVKEYFVFEKAGKRIGVFGLLGNEAFDNIIDPDSLVLEKPVQCAKRVIKTLQDQEHVDMIICLSHSGTNPVKKYSEDELLAAETQGIDLIISGHSHTLLLQPIVADGSIIASVGKYGNYLGRATFDLSRQKPELINYELTEITPAIPEDDTIKTLIAGFKEDIDIQYLRPLGIRFDDTVAHSNFTVRGWAEKGGESTLGNLVADAYVHAAQDGNKHATIGVATWGGIRRSLPEGYITEEDVFNVLSLGTGTDGKAGHPLVLLYLNGKELWDLCELDASISPVLSYAQLFFSGLHFEYNPNRMFCNRVTDVKVRNEMGDYVTPDPKKLYGVVASLYAAQMLGVVKGHTYGILSLDPKTADGVKTTDYLSAVLRDTTGYEVKEWLALERYLQELKELPSSYATPEGRKICIDDNSFVAKVKHPNGFASLVYGGAFLLIAGIVFLIVVIIRVRRKKRNAKR